MAPAAHADREKEKKNSISTSYLQHMEFWIREIKNWNK